MHVHRSSVPLLNRLSFYLTQSAGHISKAMISRRAYCAAPDQGLWYLSHIQQTFFRSLNSFYHKILSYTCKNSWSRKTPFSAIRYHFADNVTYEETLRAIQVSHPCDQWLIFSKSHLVENHSSPTDRHSFHTMMAAK